VPAFAPQVSRSRSANDAYASALEGPNSVALSPLNATGSLWAVILSALVIGRSELIGRRTILAALLIVTGGALVGAFR
jgi:drug/metabolite transporter (DMT)-like permease